MADSVTVIANEEGEYWIEVVIAGERKRAQIDCGYTGTGGGGACTVNEENWNQIKDSLTEKGEGGESTDYKGEKITPQYGKGKISIVGLDGVEVEKYITYAGSRDDLVGTTFLHNLTNVMIEWDLGAKWMTLKKKTEEEPPKEEREGMEEKLKGQEEYLDGKSIEESNKSFDEQREQNQLFYEKTKSWIAQNYCGRYVVIANGKLLSVHDDYDSALGKSASLKHCFAHRMVFKAGETPFFGKEKRKRWLGG